MMIIRRADNNDRRYMVRLAQLFCLFFALFQIAYSQEQKTSRIETVRLESKLTGTVLPYNVALPPGYSSTASQATRYPVLYLLHGLTGHYSDWFSRTNTADYAAEYRLIVVTPEGGDGWYTDSAQVPTDKYETYILQELIPDVQRRYRTIEARHGRSIAGLSMGGYGALKFGIKRPDLFTLAASMSGALAAASWSETELRDFEFVRRSIMQTFGPHDSQTRVANDLLNLVRQLPAERIRSLPFLYFDCGTEDEPGLFRSNQDLARLLVERKIPHEFRQLPGLHDWHYWDRQVREVLRIAAERMGLSSIDDTDHSPNTRAPRRSGAGNAERPARKRI